MPSTAQIAELGRTVDDVVRLAQADIAALYRTVAGSTPPAATAALTSEVPVLVQAWGDVSATVASDWYSQVRQGQPGSFTPTPSGLAVPEQTAAMVRWAVSPLFDAFDWDAAERDLLSGAGRLVRNPSRETIRDSALADPASRRWVRVPRATACPFCLMLASRGAVYTSEETASGRRGGFHDHCRCSVSVVFDDADVPEFNRALAREWKQATAGRSDQFAAWSEHISLTRTAS
jgi:hypothetical protein